VRLSPVIASGPRSTLSLVNGFSTGRVRATNLRPKPPQRAPAALPQRHTKPFTIEGPCSDPVFKPEIKAVAKEEVKSIGNDIGKAAGGLFRGLTGSKKRN
ncbi:MAG TPA: hypothetical protein VE263_13140, partial [Candidatus Angelobacter sp.]|nr:hypothetical protein [Candidatus Angelobacter sp.]